MIHLYRNQVVGPADPALVWFTAKQTAERAGFLVDPVALRYTILRQDTGAVVQAQADVNLTTAKLGTGRHALSWTVPAMQAVGEYAAVVQWKLDGDTAWRGPVEVPFEVLSKAYRLDGCALVADLYNEGVNSTAYPEARAVVALRTASAQIIRLCRRSFGPRFKTIEINGRGAQRLMFDDPICALDTVTLLDSEGVTVDSLDQIDIMVYNRHLRGLTSPDDRDNPQVVLGGTLRRLFADQTGIGLRPKGFQNVQVAGVWGYTDPDGSPVGRVPDELRRACALLAIKFLPGAATDAAAEATMGHRIQSETTRDQSYTLAARSGTQAFDALTGYPDVDSILATYRAPIEIGSA